VSKNASIIHHISTVDEPRWEQTRNEVDRLFDDIKRLGATEAEARQMWKDFAVEVDIQAEACGYAHGRGEAAAK
jgi:hypothetical protein